MEEVGVDAGKPGSAPTCAERDDAGQVHLDRRLPVYGNQRAARIPVARVLT